jgi:hypothetical protein
VIWFKVLRTIEDAGRPVFFAGEIVASPSVFAIGDRVEIMRRGSTRDPVEVSKANLARYEWPAPETAPTWWTNRGAEPPEPAKITPFEDLEYEPASKRYARWFYMRGVF